MAKPASGYVPRGARARQRASKGGRRWYADPKLWAVVVFVLGAGGYLGYWRWERTHHRIVLGKGRAAWGASFSHDGRYLAVYEPAEKPELEAVVHGYNGAGDANVRVLPVAGGTVLATFPRAQVWKGSPGPSWGGGRYVLFPTAGGDGWETRISVGDVHSKVIALSLDGANGRLSPDGRFVAYERCVEVEPDMVGPYRFYSRYKPERPEIFVFEISTRDDRQLTADGGYDPVWSPDGRTILYRRANTTEYMKQGLAWDRYEPDYDSDGRMEAPHVYSYKAKRFAGIDLMAIPRDGGEPVAVAHGGMNAHAAWVGRDSHTVSWVHWDYEPDPIADDGEFGGYRSFAYAFGHAADPDTVSLEASLMMGSAAGGEAEEVLSPAHDAIRLSTARWSRDGQRLVYERVISDSTMIVANRRAGARLGDFKDETDLHLYDRATRRSTRLVGQDDPHRTQPAWSPDGTRLAYMVHEWEIPQVEIATFDRLVRPTK
ncbi:MAG: PD40 domain-containing protein [Deltaproteobacteria bacterium]|nr:PD40 domain-containing protein [Deltaproteobacteria bacterium]